MNYGFALEECLLYQLYRLLLHPHLPCIIFIIRGRNHFKMAVTFFMQHSVDIHHAQQPIVHTFTVNTWLYLPHL
jgi:hypothetical protein